MQQVNWARAGLIYGENMDFTGGTQVRVSVTMQKYQHFRYKEILDGYNDFSTEVVVESLRATDYFVHLDVQHCMTLEASKLLSRISHNNKNTTVSSTIHCTVYI